MKMLGILIVTSFLLFSPAILLAQQESDHSMMLRRVKPAVVLVFFRAEAQQVEVGRKLRVLKEPLTVTMLGSGFIINPNGYIVTSGHLVQLYRDSNMKDLKRRLKVEFIENEYLQHEIEKKYGKKQISDERREQILRDLFIKHDSNVDVVNIRKNINVYLSNREKYYAEVKEYSPPISRMPGKISYSMEGYEREEEAGKDIAILKIEKNHLPTVKVGDANNLQLGETIYAVGFPGAVLSHDYLSTKTAYDPSVTAGIVSGQKVNVQQSFVIQTTAPLTHGNSGGPVFNSQGEVIGIATFITLDKRTGQAIQGFNFLVPEDTAMEFIRHSGVNLQEESLFNKLWFEALDTFSAGQFERALTKFDEVLRIVPGQPDAQHLRVAAQARVKRGTPVLLVAIAVPLIAIAIGLTAYIPRRRRRAASQASETFVHQEMPAVAPALGFLVGQAGPYTGRTFSIGRSGVSIGRDPGRNQIIIDDPEVSREHAWVGEENGIVVVRDLDSVNGTFINSTDTNRVQNRRLRNGDVIIIGKGNNASFIYQAEHDR